MYTPYRQVPNVTLWSIFLMQYDERPIFPFFIRESKSVTWSIPMPPSLLSSTIANTARARPQLLLLQSSTAQTCLPVLHGLIDQSIRESKSSVLLFCFLYPPSSLATSGLNSARLHIHYLTDNVPGYSLDYRDPEKLILESLKTGEFLRAIAVSTRYS